MKRKELKPVKDVLQTLNFKKFEYGWECNTPKNTFLIEKINSLTFTVLTINKHTGRKKYLSLLCVDEFDRLRKAKIQVAEYVRTH